MLACSTTGAPSPARDAAAEAAVRGASMRWQTVQLTCAAGESASVAGRLPAGFVGADLVDTHDGATWLNDHSGEDTALDDGDALRVACGGTAGFPEGTQVIASAGYLGDDAGAGRPLRWQTYDYVCPKEDGLAQFEEVDEEAATGVEHGFVATTYAIEQSDVWYVVPPTGWMSKLRLADRTVLVRCGNGNGHPAGTHVRFAMGYLDDAAPPLAWVTYRFTCPANDVKGEYLVDAASDVRTDFVASTVSARMAGSGRWSLKTRFGMASRIDRGHLRIDCGSGSGFGPGTEVLVGFAYR